MKYEKLVKSLGWRRTISHNNTVFKADKGRWHFRVGDIVYRRWFREHIHRYFLHVEHGGVRTKSGDVVDATSVYYDESDDAEQLFKAVLIESYEEKEAHKQELLEEFEGTYLS